MLLTDYAYPSMVQSFSLVAISCLQWAKYSHITGLEFVRGMGGETTQRDIVFETELQDLEGLVGPKAVIN